MNYKDDCPEYLSSWLTYISETRNRSKNTVISYYEDVKLFIRWLKIDRGFTQEVFDKIKIADFPEEEMKKVNLTDVLEFLHYMNIERNNSPTARARRAVSLRRFFKYLTDNKFWWERSPLYNLELPSPSKAVPKHLTQKEAQKLMSLNKDGTSFEEIRANLIFTLLLNCGMRLSELTAINISDIKVSDESEEEEYYYLFVHGKGSKERIVYFNDACSDVYEEYLEARTEFVSSNEHLKKEHALFLTKRGRITNRRVQQITEEALRELKLDGRGFSPHKLRHTAATLMYKNGADVRVLKEVLGHENLNTTQIYTHVADDQVRKAMKMNPLISEKKKKSGEKEKK